MSYNPKDVKLPKVCLIASICVEYSAGIFIRPILTRCCFTIINMIQVCSNFHCARLFIVNVRPDEIVLGLMVPSYSLVIEIPVRC